MSDLQLHLKGADSQAQKVAERHARLEAWLMEEGRLSESGSETAVQETLRAALQSLRTGNFDLERAGSSNCENLIGGVSVPLGVAGPVKGRFAFYSAENSTGNSVNQVSSPETLEAEVLIPLATTEGALVASVSRGCKLLRQAVPEVTVEKVGMTRAPVFACKSAAAARGFAAFLQSPAARIAALTEASSSHLHFQRVDTFIEGELVFARFVFDTEEAMGMNMVSIALQRWWEELGELRVDDSELAAALEGVRLLALSSNLCTDKKVSSLTRALGRGYRLMVSAEIPEALLQEVLHISIEALLEVYEAKLIVGSRLAGTPYQNMQLANVAAAFLLATGQDLAHTVDVSQGSLRLWIGSADGGEKALRVELSLPSVPLASVGGGTWFPQQGIARNLMGLGDSPAAWQLAGVLGLGALAGELSGLAALGTGTLACAHEALGRARKSSISSDGKKENPKKGKDNAL